MENKKAGSYSWLIWVLVGSFVLGGWMVIEMSSLSVAESGSQRVEAPGSERSQIEQLEGEQVPDNLGPVKAWLDENKPESVRGRGAAEAYTDYISISDDLETIVLDVPAEWKDIDLGHWTHNDHSIGHFIMASRDLGRFESQEAEAGVFMGVYTPHKHQGDGGFQSLFLQDKLELLGLREVEEQNISRECDSEGRYGYQDMFYQGEYDFYVDCSQGEHQILVISTKPSYENYMVLLRITITNRADVLAAAEILDSYQVVGTPGKDHHHEH